MPVLRRAAAGAALTGALLAACSEPPVNREANAPLLTEGEVDLNSYLGLWYEIARFENGFEDGCADVTAEYSLRDDGLIRVVNTCNKDGETDQATGRARIVEGSGNARLKVSFFGPFWADYWILDVPEDYSWSVVGEPEGRYLWILSRTPALPEPVLSDIVADLGQRGYRTEALHFTAQAGARRAE